MTPWACALAHSALVSSGSGSAVPDFTNSTAIMAPRTDIADPVVVGLHAVQLVLHQPFDLLGTVEHAKSISVVSMVPSAAAQATGLPP